MNPVPGKRVRLYVLPSFTLPALVSDLEKDSKKNSEKKRSADKTGNSQVTLPPSQAGSSFFIIINGCFTSTLKLTTSSHSAGSLVQYLQGRDLSGHLSLVVTRLDYINHPTATAGMLWNLWVRTAVSNVSARPRSMYDIKSACLHWKVSSYSYCEKGKKIILF